MHLRATLLVLAALFAASCGEEESPQQLLGKARAALSESQWTDASQNASAALEKLGETGDAALLLEARMTFVEAAAHGKGESPARAKSELLAMVERGELSINDFQHLTMNFLNAEEYAHAASVVEAAKSRELFEKDHLDPLGERVTRELNRSVRETGDPEAMKAYEDMLSLGYVGGDSLDDDE